MADTLVKRIGGKVKIASWIKEQLPPHNTYCEPFGGSFAVGMTLPRATEKTYRLVYNDLDQHIYNFFKVLRDQKDQLLYALELTPYSRKDFEIANELINSDKDWEKVSNVEWARCYLISNRQSFAGKEDGTWCISRQGENIAHTWNNLPPLVEKVAKHLKHAYIENSDYKDVFRRWDSPEAVFYIDPPYEHVEANYYHVNKEGGFNHVEMAEEVAKLKGSVVISYYYSEKIIEMYPGFLVNKKSVTKHMQTKNKKDVVEEILLIKKSGWGEDSNLF